MNNGAPIMEVITPIGSSDGRAITLDKASDNERNEAPIRAEAGIRALLS
jgi:hypothetical protein